MTVCVEMVARVVSVDADAHTAVVDDGERLRRISTALLVLDGGAPAVGDRVAVHTGLAVRRLDPAGTVAEARRRAR